MLVRQMMSDPYLRHRERRSAMKLLTIVAALALAGCASPGPGKYTHVPRTEKCKPTSEKKVAALFDRWNDSLQTGDPHKVVANYAEDSILLPTVSNQPKLTPAIDLRRIYLGCNVAVDAGLYTFTFGRTGQVVPARYTFTYRWDGEEWLITSHHSSVMPEPQ
jgi:hypothetical protein